MTLSKIISIKNVGRFLNAGASGDVTFRRFNLVFAENGRGKTTLCAILRSLQSGEADYILGRATLGHPGEPEVLILTSDGPVKFAEGEWDRLVPQIAVFDATFIAENVYSGDAVDTEQRRNLYRAIIGNQGVALARQIEELDAQVRAKNAEIRDAKAEVLRYVPPGTSIEHFLGLEQFDDVDVEISIKEADLAAIKQADKIRDHTELERIKLPNLPENFTGLVGKTLEGVADDAEKRITEHIAAHHMGEGGQLWLTEGLSYISRDECPYCGQPISDSDLIDAYRVFFSAAYNALKNDAACMLSEIATDFGDEEIARIDGILAQNRALTEFWKDHCSFVSPAIPTGTDLRAIQKDLRVAALAILERKIAAPLDALSIDDQMGEAVAKFEAAIMTVSAYNAAIDAANVSIAEKKAKTAAADAVAVERELTGLKAIKTRYTDLVPEVCRVYQELLVEKAKLEQTKTDTRSQLDQHTERVIAQYGKSINRYLDRINAGFEITTPAHNYRGGVPSSTYQIVINKTPVDLGDDTTPLREPSFKNTLSAGDRSTLALAFFFAELEQDPDRNNRIVVFDDPFTSQDGFRRNHTAFQIKRCGQDWAQTVVLSHDPFFLKLLWDKIMPSDRKTLQLARVGENNTTIAEWDIEKAVQAQYRADLVTLHAYYAGGEGEPRDVIQKIRPVLEGYCRNLYPTQFADDDTLGVIVGKIRAADAGHPLGAIVDDLEEVNEYCRRYHHAENANAATEPIDDNELKAYVKRTLTLAGCF